MTSAITSAQAPYNPTTQVGDVAPGGIGKEDFLKLLVAQLSHQDPTKPTDPGEFVAQLSQFTSLEQLINIKSGLDLLAITQTAGTSAQMVSFVGKEVSFDGSQVTWRSGGDPVDLSYRLDAPADEVEVRVVDGQGNTVETRTLGPEPAGERAFTFDGKKADGTALPPGTYHVEIRARDGSGDMRDVSLQERGTVSAVTFEAGYPQLVLADGRTIGLAQVLSVLAATSPTPTPTTDPERARDESAPGVIDPTHTDEPAPTR